MARNRSYRDLGRRQALPRGIESGVDFISKPTSNTELLKMMG